MDANPPFNPREILCPVDMSVLSDLSLKYAHVGAHLFDASLTILHALHFEYPRYLSRELTDRILNELQNAKSTGQRELERHVRNVLGEGRGMDRMHFQVTDTEPAEAVMQTLDQKRIDLVVMGTHGYSGLKSWMLGSVTESVLHRSSVPVFVIRQKMNDFIDTTRPEVKPNIRHILCPCNSTMAAGRALQVAGAIAGRFNARLTVLRTLESAAASDEQELTSWIRKTAGISFDFIPVVRTGTAAAEAVRLVEEQKCDLIVLGAHHKPFGQDKVMGRTTELVVRHAPVPVLAVPYGHGES